MERIAMIGLGAMGSRMARRLLDAGHPLIVFNRTASRCEPLVAAGASRAATPREAAAGAHIVISMVTDDAAAREVWLHPERGALEGVREGVLAIEASTVTPLFVGELGERTRRRGARLLDAPVAGSRPQAEAGALVFLVGGPVEALARVRPILERMGGAVYHAGELGRGALLKLAVNAYFATQVAALAEVLGMLGAKGIDPERAMGVLGALPITSPALAGVGAAIVAGRFDPMFPIDLVEKDLRYALELGAPMPTIARARDEYARAIERGHGAENIHAIARLYLAQGAP